MEGLGKLPRTTRGVRKSVVVTKQASGDFVEKFYDLVEMIGSGAFGTVMLVCDLKTKEQRVCKVVSTEGMQKHQLEMMHTEVEMLCILDHPHVVKIFEYALDTEKGELVVVMEHLAGGDCMQLLQNAKPGLLSEGLVARLIHQVFMALNYCHSLGILHRDIKPDNLLLCSTEVMGIADCKLIDFGVSTRSSSDERGIFGTLSHIAPEVAGQSGDHIYTEQADVWSAGVTTFQLLTGMVPFGRPTVSAGVLAGLKHIANYKGFDEDVGSRVSGHSGWESRSTDAQDFVRWMLTADPANRPCCSEVLEHPWLQTYKATTECLTPEMVQSLTSYPLAPPLVRCCLYAIAARKSAPDLERFATAFLRLDTEGIGKLSRNDLDIAVGRKGINVDSLLSAADLDHTGGINYTEFVAACLYARFVQRGSLEDLLRSAFEALDSDRDGLIQVADIRQLFRERDAPFLGSLPQNQPFDLRTWIATLQSAGKQQQHQQQSPPLAIPVSIARSAVADFNAYEASPVPQRQTGVRFAPVSERFSPVSQTLSPQAGSPQMAASATAPGFQQPGMLLPGSNPMMNWGNVATRQSRIVER